MTDLVEVRRGAYYDSVSLMQVSKAVRDAPGISAALVAMATDLNIDLLAGMGFTVAEAVGPKDMLVAFRGEDQAAIEAGTSALDAALAGLKAAGASAGGFGEAPPPRTLGTAAARGGANLALISVPGVNAFVETMDAVTSGLSVVLFSDNVSVEQEIALKDAAAASLSAISCSTLTLSENSTTERPEVTASIVSTKALTPGTEMSARLAPPRAAAVPSVRGGGASPKPPAEAPAALSPASAASRADVPASIAAWSSPRNATSMSLGPTASATVNPIPASRSMLRSVAMATSAALMPGASTSGTAYPCRAAPSSDAERLVVADHRS